LKFEDQRAQIENCAVGIEVHEEVDVASRHRVAPRHRAEHTDVARPVALRDALDLIASCAGPGKCCSMTLDDVRKPQLRWSRGS
jgi:hypothetical protein